LKNNYSLLILLQAAFSYKPLSYLCCKGYKDSLPGKYLELSIKIRISEKETTPKHSEDLKSNFSEILFYKSLPKPTEKNPVIPGFFFIYGIPDL
jgi:hypothetical protein